MPTQQQLLEIISTQTEIAKLGLDLGGVMAIVVEKTLSLVDADGAAIELVEGPDMAYRAASGMAKDFLGMRISRENSLSGLCVSEGQALNCMDAELDSRVNLAACRKIGLRSMIVVPLKHQNTTIGVLKALSAHANHFSENTIKVLQLLTELVAASMFYADKYNNESLFHKATHDGMTGLANRSLFMDRLRNLLSQSARNQKLIGILIIDMNGLKQINDSYGHGIGDVAIMALANRIKTATRLTDTVARLGGDEFGVILNPIEGKIGITEAINRISTNIGTAFMLEDNSYPLSASIGYAAFPDDATELHDLMELADKRMYASKSAHKKQH